MPEVRSAIPAREILRRYHEAWWPSLPTLWRICMRRTQSTNPHFHWPAPRNATPGREQLRAGYRQAWSRTPLRIDSIENVTVHETLDPNLIIAEQERVGTIEPIGEGVPLPSLLVLRLQDGLISHVRDYLDVLRIVSLVRGAMNRREAE
jgi:ketosteroid isomerase-like protein